MEKFGFYVTMTGYGGILEKRVLPEMTADAADDLDNDRVFIEVQGATVSTFDLKSGEAVLRVFGDMGDLSPETYAALAVAILAVSGDQV